MMEVVVGVSLFALVFLGLAGSAAAGLRGTSGGRDELQTWAAYTRVTDSLRARGAANLTNGSAVFGTTTIEWNVSGSTLKQVTLIVQRPQAGTIDADTSTILVGQ